MNRIVIIGNLTKDPELRATNSGVSVCTFSVAVTRNRANANGEKLTDFFNIVTWRGVADTGGKYIKKGSKVAIAGYLQNRSSEKDGITRYITEIVADELEFLNTKAKDATQGEYDAPEGFEVVEENSDLPF